MNFENLKNSLNISQAKHDTAALKALLQQLREDEHVLSDDDPFKKTKEYLQWNYKYDASHSVPVTLEFLHSDEEMYEAFLKLSYAYMTYCDNNGIDLINKNKALKEAREKAKQNGFKPFDKTTDTIAPLPEFTNKECPFREAYLQSKKNDSTVE